MACNVQSANLMEQSPRADVSFADEPYRSKPGSPQRDDTKTLFPQWLWAKSDAETQLTVNRIRCTALMAVTERDPVVVTMVDLEIRARRWDATAPT